MMRVGRSQNLSETLRKAIHSILKTHIATIETAILSAVIEELRQRDEKAEFKIRALKQTFQHSINLAQNAQRLAKTETQVLLNEDQDWHTGGNDSDASSINPTPDMIKNSSLLNNDESTSKDGNISDQISANSERLNPLLSRSNLTPKISSQPIVLLDMTNKTPDVEIVDDGIDGSPLWNGDEDVPKVGHL